MPSPFPGMNPYFEQPDVWPGFHGSLLVHLREELAARLGPQYFVDYEVAIYTDDSVEGPYLFGIADATVGKKPRRGSSTSVSASVLTAPVTASIPLPIERKDRRLIVRDVKGRAIVTVIEVLSPSNKTPGKDRARYLEKRDQVLRSSAHLVEIDLLRGGTRPPIHGLPPADYVISISRVSDRPAVGVWPIRLRDPLPTIPIPLRLGDPEPAIDLGRMIHDVYDRAGYARYLYDGMPSPRLSAADAAWAKRLRAAAKPV